VTLRDTLLQNKAIKSASVDQKVKKSEVPAWKHLLQYAPSPTTGHGMCLSKETTQKKGISSSKITKISPRAHQVTVLRFKTNGTTLSKCELHETSVFTSDATHHIRDRECNASDADS